MQIMLKNKLTSAPSTSTSAPIAPPTTAHNKVEEISPGKVNIKGCSIDINHVFYTYVDQNGRKNACLVSVSVTNNSGKAVKFDSLCKIRVKQDNKTCTYVDVPLANLFDPDEPIEAGRFASYKMYYLIWSFTNPVQVQLLYQGRVLTEFTYDPSK
jgi:hypothetical protein